MSWFKGSIVFFLVSMGSISASGFATAQSYSPSPPSIEQPRNYFGYAEASYTYWIAKRDNGGTFISNYYYPATAAGVQGSIGYTPSNPHSGFKVAAGFQSLERAISFGVTYTWFNNKGNPVGIFSFPGSTGYVGGAPSFTSTSGGTTQSNSQFQRVDVLFINELPQIKYLSFKLWYNLFIAWEKSSSNFSFANDALGSITNTLDQTWSACGPELGITVCHFLLKGKKNQLFLRGVLGAGQGWGSTKTVALEVEEPTGKTIFSGLDRFTTVSTVVDLEMGFGYSNQNVEKQTPYVEFGAFWDFQTWSNTFSSFNVPVWSIQGLTLSLGYTF